MGNQSCCEEKPSDPLDSLATTEAELTAKIEARLRVEYEAKEVRRRQQQHQKQLQPPAVSVSDSKYCDIFISLRYAEANREAIILQKALEIEGKRAYINATVAGGNMWSEIAEQLEHCRLVVCMGSETYGERTDSINSTFEELQVSHRCEL
jgi:hypothetical protein